MNKDTWDRIFTLTTITIVALFILAGTFFQDYLTYVGIIAVVTIIIDTIGHYHKWKGDEK